MKSIAPNYRSSVLCTLRLSEKGIVNTGNGYEKMYLACRCFAGAFKSRLHQVLHIFDWSAKRTGANPESIFCTLSFKEKFYLRIVRFVLY